MCTLGPTWVANNAPSLPPKLRASLLQSHLSPTVLEILVNNFSMIDKDKNCKLSVDEITVVFREGVGVSEVSEADVQALVAAVDVDKDNEVKGWVWDTL